MRLNLEIVGIAAFGLAVLLGVSLAAPTHSGVAGKWLGYVLTAGFGAAAPLVPVLIAIIGAIVFLEINVPRLMAKFGFAALAYFLLLDTAYGRAGGAAGGTLDLGLRTLLGGSGATILLVVLALSLTVWIGGLSVKKTIGWIIVGVAKLRAFFARRRRTLPARKPAAPAGPQSLREAFHLPAVIAPVAPLDTRTFIAAEPANFVPAAPVRPSAGPPPDAAEPGVDEYDEDDEYDEYEDDEDEDEENGN